MSYRSEMKATAQFAFLIVVVLLVVAAGVGIASWMARAGHLAQESVFAPAHEQVRRNTFEGSKAYRDGVVQELRSMQFAYLQAAPEHRAGLASVIRHKVAGVPVDAIPLDLQQFIQELP